MRLPVEHVLHYPDAISQVQATDAGVYWLARIADQDGRVSIRRLADGMVTDLTPEASVRSRAMEYGGGAYCADGANIAYCDDTTGQVMLHDGYSVRPLTPEKTRFIYGGLRLSLTDRVVLAVREDHGASPEPRTEIVALDLDQDNTDGGRVLVTGADFYAGIVTRAGRIAWYQWNHPDMSWDTCEVWSASLEDPSDATAVFAKPGVSALYPHWIGKAGLVFAADESGFWNWRVQEGRSWQVARDCAPPSWILDPAPAVVVDDRILATVEFADGLGALALWDTVTGGISYPLPGTTAIDSIASHAGVIYTIAEWPDREATLIAIRPDGTRELLAGPAESAHSIAQAQPIWADGPAGPVHAWLYHPGRPNPPLIVLTHGGPTSMTTSSYDAGIQFWVSRGFAVADVNYSGSTGFGRAYRDRLRGAWGELDVADTAAVVHEITHSGLADPKRVAITGGSAGGFTTLRSLVSTDVYAAGISRYGVADLTALAVETHKAESHYLDGLIAPWPDGREIYEARSPLNNLGQLHTPMLILQGSQDRVVPPSQAEVMADAVRAAGLPVALIMFEGEGHGFRSMRARRRSLEAQVSFLEQVFGMPLSDDVPHLNVENL